MKISEYAVKNYQFTLVIFLMIVALGATTLLNMSRSEDPEINAPQFPVVIIYPGTSPQDMEELVVDPLEKKISELEDIKKIMTNISDGVAVMQVFYKYESDVDDKYQELIREVNGLRDELPKDIYSIEVDKVSPSGVNIMQIALISENASRKSLKFEAERLQEELEKLTELKDVEIHGLPEEIVRVDLRLEKMASMNVPLNAVIGSLQNEMTNIPGGSVEAGLKSFNVKTSGDFDKVEEIANTIVFSLNGKNILLKEIADVRLDHEVDKHITRLNGHRSIFVTAAQKTGYNISQTQEKYKPVLEAYAKALPSNIDMVQHFDQADNVNKRLGSLGIDFMIAILLVSITLLPLGGRAALIVMISIPLSLSIGLVILNVLGYNLNQLSIVGLVVALGLLVDDSIVVVENIERWLREGHSRMQATILATKQIGLAVVGCTVTLVIAFLPLVFLPEGAGDFIRSLPMAVITSVLASMLVSLTIIPFLSSRILKEHAGHPEGNVFLRSLQKVIHSSYAPLLNVALKRPLATVAIAAVIFVSSLLLFPVIGFSLFPMSEKPQFLVNVISPLQSKLGYTDEVAKEVEEELEKIPDVTYFATNVGKGNPRIYYNEIPENERTDFAQLFVQLDESTSMERKLEITEALRSKFSQYPGARVEVKNFEQGPPVTAPVEVRLLGNNLDTLRMLAGRVENILKMNEASIYVDNPVSNLKSDIKVDINKEKARMLGVNTLDIARTVRLAVAGLPVGSYSDADGEDRDVLLTTPRQNVQQGRPTLDAFEHMHVNNMQGDAIPIRQIADLSLEASPLTIDHYNKTRMVAVSSFVRKGFLTDNVIQQVIQEMDAFPFPTGYTYMMGGEYESRQESFGGFGTVIIVTVFLFIAVLILEFKTFKSTLIVLSVIPLGMVGALLALWMTGNSLSFVAIIGLIALAGIEVKNSILLVDFTNQLREEGRSLEEAIREAGELRFLPIILTTLTAIGGLTPIAISSNPLISPLAIVLIGGLISSTLLSRIVTPIVYKLIPPRIEQTAEKRQLAQA
ncbi:efflux RND transporter permease subunit [Catalinimonas niigatensis]|uniref:efflux RND transporter permease subunit n=1 Tax=Catalinimonas niigatensis TaxID=1397264 RepID=UPI002665DE2D|nr:efflux RND transporter permease subunit [Catalinimonas niigatensis]WPP50420.1 efflux RND transporter permease subunit [Catalinimonas niigatensis]